MLCKQSCIVESECCISMHNTAQSYQGFCYAYTLYTVFYPKYWESQAWANDVDNDQTQLSVTWWIAGFVWILNKHVFFFGSVYNLSGSLWNLFVYLTHLSLASHKRDTGKQCRPRSDAEERGVWWGSLLFALSSEIPTKHADYKT